MPSSATNASRVSTFLDSIGVNVHMGYFDTPYGDSAAVISKLGYLGVHHVRDGAAWFGWVPPLAELGEAGIKLDLIIGGKGDTLDAQFANLEELAPYIATVEGVNEVNLSPVTYNGQTGIAAAVSQQAFINQRLEEIPALKDKPLVSFSVATSTQEGFTRYGDNSGPNDYGNAHVYFPAGTPPGSHIAKYVDMAQVLTPGDRMFLTETGLPTNAGGPGNQGVSETAQAKHTLDVLMGAYQHGVARTFLYELQDQFPDPDMRDQEHHYGLFRNDGSAKPAAVALHNFTTILSDTASTAGSFTPGSLNYSVTGLASSGSHMLMQEANGNFDIVIWNEAVIWDDAKSRDLAAPRQDVTVNLGETFETVNVYDPLVGASPIATYHNISDLVLGITDHPLIVETVGSSEPAADEGEGEGEGEGLVGTQTVGSGPNTLVLRVSEDAYRGDAKFTVSVDGKQIGGTLTTQAIRKSGQYENIEIKGNWAAGGHRVDVTFLNDAWAGTADTDRNLYVESATYNGNDVAGAALGSVIGTDGFSLSEGTAKLVLRMSEDAWRGDAQFKVWVDGIQLGGVQTVTALHAEGKVQEFSFEGGWTAGEHQIRIEFLNDAYGGTANTDRNLYVEEIGFGSERYEVNTAMLSGGAVDFDNILFG